jgi:hypothetical protein
MAVFILLIPEEDVFESLTFILDLRITIDDLFDWGDIIGGPAEHVSGLRQF